LLIYAGAVALTAVQIITGIEVGSESVRGAGVPYEFAAEFSFAPENLATLVVPGFFGDIEHVKYWGRNNFWEMNFFISITGFVLAILGAIFGDRNTRRFSVVMVVILMILALGAHTPLHRILYSYVPGFNKFRGSSKFIFFASLYLIMLAAIGMDGLIKGRKIHRNIIVSCFCAALALVGLAISIWLSVGKGDADGLWAKILLAVYNTGESSWADDTFHQSMRESAIFAYKCVLLSSGLFGFLGISLLLTKMFRRMVYLLALLGIAELVFFASGLRPTFPIQDTQNRELIKLKTMARESDRIINLVNPNGAMSLEMNDIWGDDPGVLGRYARFMTYTQGGDPDRATQFVLFSRMPKLYEMLRCRYAIVYEGDKRLLLQNNHVMPVACLIDTYRLIRNQKQILEEMTKQGFDPRETVILETRPAPEPSKSKEKGSVKVTYKSAEEMVIEADLLSSKILLITDSYSKGWRARALPGSTQQSYQVMPANYVLRGIPLRKGYHHISLEYEPPGFMIGKWISVISGVIYLFAISWWLWQRGIFSFRAKK